MAKINAYQSSFTAGELSPRMYARSDTEGYASGLKECFNMITRSQGPVSKRPGFRFVESINGSYARVFPFQLTAESDLGEAFPIVMSDDNTFSVFGAEGSVAGEQKLANPSFNEGGAGWAVNAEGDGAAVNFSSGLAILTTINDNTKATEISRSFVIDPSESNQNWTAGMVVVPVQSNVFNFPAVYLKIGTAPGLSDVTVTNGVFNTGTNTLLYVTIGIQGGNYENIIIPGEPDQLGTYTRSIEEVSVRSSPVNIGDLIFAHDWNAQDIKNAWYTMPPAGDTMYILTPLKQPYKLTYDKESDAWLFDKIGFVSRPSEWKDGSWPSCVTFFQGRSWWAGVNNAPEKIWSSVSAQIPLDYERFRIGALAADSVIISNAKRGKIRWMEGLRNLVFGSVYGEFIVTSSGGVITPGDVSIEQQSANGSAMSQTVPIGNTAIHVSGDRTKLRVSNFQWTEQAWLTKDITFTSDHIGELSPFQAGTYARNPDSVVWYIMQDGTMAATTFESFTQINGWHRHQTSGEVLSLGAIEIDGQSVVYAIVKRSGFLYLEVMDNSAHMDSFVFSDNQSNVTSISDINHLAGRVVVLLIDGAMYTSTVTPGGLLNLPRPGKKIYVGLPFESRVVKLPHEGGSEIGSAIISTKRNAKNKIRVYQSVIPLINGLRPNVRTASTPMGQAQPLYSGYIDQSEVGYSQDADMVISDSTPYPLNISGIYAYLDMGQVL